MLQKYPRAPVSEPFKHIVDLVEAKAVKMNNYRFFHKILLNRPSVLSYQTLRFVNLF